MAIEPTMERDCRLDRGIVTHLLLLDGLRSTPTSGGESSGEHDQSNTFELCYLGSTERVSSSRVLPVQGSADPTLRRHSSQADRTVTPIGYSAVEAHVDRERAMVARPNRWASGSCSSDPVYDR